MAGEPELLHSLVGGSGDLERIPLVVVNQSNGVGLEFERCQVTDAHFLRIVLGAGEYHRGAKFDSDKRITFNVETLYSSGEEAAEILDSVFAEHLGLLRYRAAVRWTTNRIPLAGDEGEPQISYPVVDEATYFGLGPFSS